MYVYRLVMYRCFHKNALYIFIDCYRWKHARPGIWTEAGWLNLLYCPFLVFVYGYDVESTY